jgi:hypothetical protein
MAPCLKPGALVVLAGRPGMGKTGAALASMLRAARDGSHVLFFSLEMTAQDLANRLIADLCYDPRQPISYFDLERGNVADADWDRIDDARRLLHGIPLVIEEQPALSVSQIAARARKEQQRRRRPANWSRLLDRGDRGCDQVWWHRRLRQPPSSSGRRIAFIDWLFAPCSRLLDTRALSRQAA